MHHLKLPGLAGALTAGVTDGVKPARRLPAHTQSQQAQGRPVCVCVVSFLAQSTFSRFVVWCLQKKVKKNKRVTALISGGRCENNQGGGNKISEMNDSNNQTANESVNPPPHSPRLPNLQVSLTDNEPLITAVVVQQVEFTLFTAREFSPSPLYFIATELSQLVCGAFHRPKIQSN